MAAHNSDVNLLVIVGPTASGKTALAIEVAKKYNGEIVCADSRTVYRYLDIGTAKPTTEEQREVPHHLLDVVNPDEPFTVFDFQQLAKKAIKEIQSRGKLPILVGGSGLYIDAVIYDYQFTDGLLPRDAQNPRHLAAEFQRKDLTIRPNTLMLGLKADRSKLAQRITQRVERMIEQSFLDEVKNIKANFPDSKALDAPGYKAFSAYLDGDISLLEAKAQFVRNDMNLAKRQMSWFKRNPYIQWFEHADGALRFLEKKILFRSR